MVCLLLFSWTIDNLYTYSFNLGGDVRGGEWKKINCIALGECFLFYLVGSHSIESKEVVYSVVFSQNGESMESGLFDKCTNMWSLKKKKIVKTYNGECWNNEVNEVLTCFAYKIFVCLIFDCRGWTITLKVLGNIEAKIHNLRNSTL